MNMFVVVSFTYVSLARRSSSKEQNFKADALDLEMTSSSSSSPRSSFTSSCSLNTKESGQREISEALIAIILKLFIRYCQAAAQSVDGWQE